MKAAFDGTSEVVIDARVEILEIAQGLEHKLFCFGRHRKEDALLKKVQVALWTIEELLEVLRLRNEFVEMRVALANDEC